jgi:hypothetical protein
MAAYPPEITVTWICPRPAVEENGADLMKKIFLALMLTTAPVHAATLQGMCNRPIDIAYAQIDATYSLLQFELPEYHDAIKQLQDDAENKLGELASHRRCGMAEALGRADRVFGPAKR